ncbi:hypothetical protein [Euzebyella saccharophila]|uniref:Uncharacterized protein n=1 Tax=Euzebyella saccharophila TaxID=679664 RepID=A0ABV8JLR8_9FLAO|nr:hypothetical protein [Euzebyella saccharophila]
MEFNTKFITRCLAVCFLILSGTISRGQEKEVTKMQQVMAQHDEVMDEMPKLSKLINQLQTKANASYKKEKYENAISDLKLANKSMMSWMANFGKRFEADEMMKGKELTEKKKRWLLEEEKKVALLKEEIELSISQAERVLGN